MYEVKDVVTFYQLLIYHVQPKEWQLALAIFARVNLCWIEKVMKLSLVFAVSNKDKVYQGARSFLFSFSSEHRSKSGDLRNIY